MTESVAIVLLAYGIDAAGCTITPFGTGLINNTWDIKTDTSRYILQRINNKIFTQPEAIAANIHLLADYISIHAPGYTFIATVPTVAGNPILENENGYFRLFPFVDNSHTIDVVQYTQQAYEAARQFGLFTRTLSSFNANDLQITLPDFHNLSLRYRQFEQALLQGNAARVAAAKEQIELLKKHSYIADTFELIKNDPDFKIRVTHHDTKISNVLFDAADKGICVIDLDTVMPGYFISDVGDMMRTYLSPVSEEETDFSKITVRKEFLDAVIQGYSDAMQDDLTPKEKTAFIYAGKFMIYMQALRFLTDHLNNDSYYGARYQGHNFNRAVNQLVLLEKLIETEAAIGK
ncbi:MAG: aminoglycoside phosphotransferase family protein [Ferruginibacter sp.]